MITRMNVIYNGIRFTADEIVAAAREKAPHVIGLSILSGSHVPLAGEVVAKLNEAGLSDVEVKSPAASFRRKTRRG